MDFDPLTILGSGATAWAAVYFSLNGHIKELRSVVEGLREELRITRSQVGVLEERVFEFVRGRK